MVFPTTDLRCRQIDGGDIATVASLLTRGFPKRDRQYWLRAFAQLTERELPPGLPKYGYLMESEGVPVGTILLICSTMRTGDAVVQRCNFSSWYVEPKFRRLRVAALVPSAPAQGSHLPQYFTVPAYLGENRSSRFFTLLRRLLRRLADGEWIARRRSKVKCSVPIEA